MSFENFLSSITSVDSSLEKERKLINDLLVLSQPSNTDFTLVHPKTFSLTAIEKEVISVESFLVNLFKRMFEIFQVNNNKVDPFITKASIPPEQAIVMYVNEISRSLALLKKTEVSSKIETDKFYTKLSFKYVYNEKRLAFFIRTHIDCSVGPMCLRASLDLTVT